jgi:tetratricopeptide (TPR) repeat protein
LRYYLGKITHSGSTLEKAISLWHEISRSSEAKRKSSEQSLEWPRIHFPNAAVGDLIGVAHRHAAQERLDASLHSIASAIALKPDDGELLRFKASILERMGSFEEALKVAREAEVHGANPKAIKQDIERLHRRYLVHLDTTSGRVLPDFHRQQRDAAAVNGERIRRGLKLASRDEPSPEDLIDLAHAYAEDEKLWDALYWIGKAIEVHPDDGEILRFKASILERIGRFEEALQVAEEASRCGAHRASIASDLERISRGFIADLRKDARSENPARSLTSYAKLLQTKNLRLSDLIRFVGLTVASYARMLKSQR